jgi:hypothetical protein
MVTFNPQGFAEDRSDLQTTTTKTAGTATRLVSARRCANFVANGWNRTGESYFICAKTREHVTTRSRIAAITEEAVDTALYDDLKTLRTELPRLAELLMFDAGAEMDSWSKILELRLLTRFDPRFPLVAAICGGGSSGKSTLFNSLLGGRFAPTGGRAGMNRRVLFAVPERLAEQARFIAGLVEPFAAAPEPLRRPEELLQLGSPLYLKTRAGLSEIILMDTPDFDTGAGGQYANRQSAQGALEAADLLIYIFTNSNYNNRDNTDFIARMLTGIGRRKCFLVYRCYPSFTADEVTEHAMTVARNIYGADAERWVLGIFRADEDNRVAAGERRVELRPASAQDPAFDEALGALDVQRLRGELYAATLTDILRDARVMLAGARRSLDALQRYAAALQEVQHLCLQEALRYFPMDRVMRRFAKIWAASDPPAVRLMRRTGSVIELPLKAAIGAVGWARETFSGERPPEKPTETFARRLEENLVVAATTLHQQLVSPAVSRAAVRGVSAVPGGPAPGGGSAEDAVSAHPVAAPAQERLRQKEFHAILQSVLARQAEIGDIGAEMERELRALADHFRSRMGLWDKVGQTFWAFLNVLPAAAAVSYVLSTGDPVGGTAIKVKLAGLFGLKDLYALVAIPVTRGMKKADQKQLEAMLAPIARTWFDHKFKKVQALFEQEISGDLRQTLEQTAAAAGRCIAAVDKAIVSAAEGDLR